MLDMTTMKSATTTTFHICKSFLLECSNIQWKHNYSQLYETNLNILRYKHNSDSKEWYQKTIKIKINYYLRFITEQLNNRIRIIRFKTKPICPRHILWLKLIAPNIVHRIPFSWSWSIYFDWECIHWSQC